MRVSDPDRGREGAGPGHRAWCWASARSSGPHSRTGSGSHLALADRPRLGVEERDQAVGDPRLGEAQPDLLGHPLGAGEEELQLANQVIAELL